MTEPVWKQKDGLPDFSTYRNVQAFCHPKEEVIVAINVAERSLFVCCATCAAPIADFALTGQAAIYQGQEHGQVS